jgi:hypothetical protein
MPKFQSDHTLMAEPNRTVTVDLSDLKLTDEQFKKVQASLHQTAIQQIAQLPPFEIGVGVRPILGGGLINGIVIENLKGSISGGG